MKNCLALGAALLTFGITGAAIAKDGNPIFAKSAVQVTTPAENKSVVGKGYYANLYGYYGNYYSAYASYYGAQASYNQNYSDYSYASSYAYDAYYYYNQASMHQQSGT